MKTYEELYARALSFAREQKQAAAVTPYLSVREACLRSASYWAKHAVWCLGMIQYDKFYVK
jgi:hypothetical protein